MNPDKSVPHWNLDQLYVLDSPLLKADLERLQTMAAEFNGWRERLSQAPPTAEEFRALVETLASLTALAHRLSGFADLAFSQDTQDQRAQAFLADMDEKMARLNNELLFFKIWWKQLPEEEAESLLEATAEFGYWLRRTRALRRYSLSEAQERVVNLKNTTGCTALVSLYDSITNRYRYHSQTLPDVPDREMSRDELMMYVRSDKPAVRAAAYRELYRVFGQDGPILGQIYQSVVRDWRLENMELRGYESPIAVRNLANDLSASAVDSLLEVCRSKVSLFGEFFHLKARVLGLGRLTRYDLYAPLVVDSESLDFRQGLTEVLAAFYRFSPQFKELASRIVDEGRLSARPAPGKRGGAFCYSMTPEDTPWVMMTYNGRRQDLFTLAHELGHGIHSQLAVEHNIFHFHATLPLAETASTFGEMLLASRLLGRAKDKRQRADLLFHLLDDAYATVGRQAFFALFETQAHQMLSQGATVDEVAEAYLENLRLQFGESLDLSDEFRWEWVSIPHIFHTPFYVYAYSFGQLLVYSLWRLYESQGQAFAPRLTELLAAGGSAPPEEILSRAQLGPLDHKFWEGGFEVIAGFLEELKALI